MSTIINPYRFGGTPARTFLVDEGAEGSGTPSGWTDTNSPDWDYTTGPLVGSQSLRINTSSSTAYSNKNFTASNPVHAYFRLKWATLPGTNIYLFYFTVSGTMVCRLRLSYGNALGVAFTGSPTNASSTLSTGTLYHVWFSYYPGSGADAVATVGFSTDGVKPTTGDTFATRGSGTGTAAVDGLSMGILISSTSDVLYDMIRVDGSAIGDNGE